MDLTKLVYRCSDNLYLTLSLNEKVITDIKSIEIVGIIRIFLTFFEEKNEKKT